MEAFAHLGIASGLSDEQQRKLASLVRHFYVEGGSVKWLDPHRQEWREWQRNPRTVPPQEWPTRSLGRTGALDELQDGTGSGGRWEPSDGLLQSVNAKRSRWTCLRNSAADLTELLTLQFAAA